MRILLGASELFPYSKTGGLSDMVGALAKWLAKAGHKVGVVTPLYRGIAEQFPAIKPFPYQLDLPLGTRTVSAQVRVLEAAPRLTIYFIDVPEFYDRSAPYQDNGVDYPDNAERFIYFAKCVAHLGRYLPWKPELLHVHDWQVGLVPTFLLDYRLRESGGNQPRTCFTIHNLAFQGTFPRAKYPLTNLPWDYFQPAGLEFYGSLNCLKAGILHADQITTVSARYAREITTEEFGCGLDGALRARAGSLLGILNGVDYEEWNTDENSYLKHPYTLRDLTGKAAEKAALQAEMALPVRAAVPLFGSVTRLTDQKGVDLQLSALEEMLAKKIQFVLLGSGARPFEAAFRDLQKRFPEQVSVRIGFDQGLSHRIEAGCDFFLMPSRFEPCGLNQMYSLRYGTIPIVRRTGGLDDSVVDAADAADATEAAARANGIKFSDCSAPALVQAMRKALAVYEEAAVLRQFRANAMTADFSWAGTARRYAEVYRQILAR